MKAVILAAGDGKRMKSVTSKVLHHILDKAIVEYVADLAKASGADEVIIVVSESNHDQIEDRVSGVTLAVQRDKYGTGGAVIAAAELIPDDEDILILFGDSPLVTKKSVSELTLRHAANGNDATVISVKSKAPHGYGRIVRHGDRFRIIEQRDLTDEQKSIDEINTGVCVFKGKSLKAALAKLKDNNDQREYMLTDTMEIITSAGGQAEAVLSDADESEFFGINDRVQLAAAAKALQRRINEYHMYNGVTIINPDTTLIGDGVEIGQDTVIYPGTRITRSKIGANCTIGSYSTIIDSEISDDVDVQYSVITESKVGAFTTVGPFAYMRAHSVVGSHCRFGDFVEIKNSVIGDNTKAAHLAYIGDADAGNGINFGCGTITANYDGKTKNRTVIEDGVFIGSNSNLVAPVTVRKGAYVAAGSTITEDVPENSLGIARARQVNKEGWKRR